MMKINMFVKLSVFLLLISVINLSKVNYVQSLNVSNPNTIGLNNDYKKQAIEPFNYNWLRESKFNAKQFPYKKWENNMENTMTAFFSDITIKDDVIYFVKSSSTEKAVSLNALNSDGTEKWSVSIPRKAQNFNSGSAPVIGEDGTIYFNTTGRFERPGFENVPGTIVAVSSDGKIKWEYSPVTDYNVFVASNIFIASSGEIILPVAHRRFRDNAKIIAIAPDGKSERDIIKIPLKSANEAYDEPYFNINNEVHIAQGSDSTLYVTTNGNIGRHKSGLLISFTPSGVLNWRFVGKYREDFKTPSIIGKDNTIYTVFNNHLTLFNSKGEIKKVSSVKTNARALALFEEETIYVFSHSENYRDIDFLTTSIDLFNLDGENIQSINFDGAVICLNGAPVITSDGKIYFTAWKGGWLNRSNRIAKFYAMNPDGSIEWVHDTGRYARFSRVALDSEGTLYTFLAKINENRMFQTVLYSLGTKYIDIVIDGEVLETDTHAKLINNRTMVPMRAIFEALGAEVKWDPTTRTVTGISNDRIVQVEIDKKEAIVNGTKVSSDIAPFISNNRTYVPVRLIAESFGADVRWDGDYKVVYINIQK